jgi:hypothetical protein
VHARGRAFFGPDGRATRLSGVSWDVSEQRRMEAALREGEQRFRDAVEASCDWVWETDAERRFTYVLDRSGVIDAPAEWFLGRSVEEVMAGTVEQERLEAHLRDLEARRPFRDFVYWIRRESWRGADLRDLALQELEPHAGAAEFEARGEPVRLGSAAAVSFAMAFHELTTNAVKYGALSRPGGRVAIDWRREGGRLLLRWVESGGPPVSPSPPRGFGSLLIERGLAYELRGEARLEFRPEGVRCLVDAPLEEPA